MKLPIINSIPLQYLLKKLISRYINGILVQLSVHFNVLCLQNAFHVRSYEDHVNSDYFSDLRKLVVQSSLIKRS